MIQDLFIRMEGLRSMDALYRLLVLLASSALVIWLLWLLFSLAARRSPESRDHALPLAFLRSLTGFIVLFSIYFFYVIKLNGLHTFRWNATGFYWAIGPFLLVFATVILIFFLQYARYTRALKQ